MAGPGPEVYALPPGLEDRMEALLAAGDRDAVVETVFRGLELLSDEDMRAFKAAPSWPGRVAAAHTIGREVRAETEARLDPEQANRITVPTLLLTGEHSSDPSKADIEAVAAALPDAPSWSWRAKSTSRTSSSPRSSPSISWGSCDQPT
jgi:pimeloyl-ACP methyl ester carboxylesterase